MKLFEHRKFFLVVYLLMCTASYALEDGAYDAHSSAHAEQTNAQPPSADQDLLLDKAIQHEHEVVAAVRARTPMIETYVQHVKSDVLLGQVPSSDEHMLRRFASVPAKASGRKSAKEYAELSRLLFPDADEFDRTHYSFRFIRPDFLGTTKTLVFDVSPLRGASSNQRFTGRIWVESRDGFIVRFVGDSGGRQRKKKDYARLDAWRVNVKEQLWLPTSAYEEQGSGDQVRYKATTQVWGYLLKTPVSGNVDIAAVGANDESAEAADLNPLSAQREWMEQAEDAVVSRLQVAGLLDAPSEIDKTLEAVAENILAYNNIYLSRPIRCRILLTQPLESLSVGNTIIVSKSLLNTTRSADNNQQIGNLYAILAFQIAHIVLGHRMDMKYAFNDRLLFPKDTEIERIPMHHTDADNEAAARKAIELLNVSELKGSQQYFGLYLSQLKQRAPGLKALTQPVLGDGLLQNGKETTFWLGALIDRAPKLPADAESPGASSLADFVHTNPWTDELVTVSQSPAPFLVAENHFPFEIEPPVSHFGYAPLPASGSGQTEAPYQVVRIFFATDRSSKTDADTGVTFSGARSERDELNFGSAEVSVPRDHRMGELERPSLLRLELREDPAKHVVLLRTTTLDLEKFRSEMAERLRDDPGRQALVFVHGYNVTFEEAARRLGQMTYDLGFAGAPILYSWPSKGSLLGYTADEASVEWSSPHFLKFLQTLQADEDIKTIYVISHSMGNRLVASALPGVGATVAKSKIQEVIMAAPDIDAGVFQHIAIPLRHSAAHVTIYESSKDLALEISHHYHDFSRLGDTDPKVHVFSNYECIEASAVSTGLIGHSYVGDSGSILSDIFEILQHGSPASERFRLSPRTLDGMTYWSFKP